MTEVRSGLWAQLGDRRFPVRSMRKGVYQEWEPHGTLVRLVGPEYAAGDLDSLVDVRATGLVAGHRFELSTGPGDEVTISDHVVGDDVVDRLGLTGNRYDGWRGQVPFAEVEDVREEVRDHTGRGGAT